MSRPRAGNRAWRMPARLPAHRRDPRRRARSANPASDVTRFHELMRLLERGATDQELIDAAAMLAAPPSAKQGRLL